MGQAAGGVTAVQSALRPAQDLDPLHVEQHEAGAGHLRDIHFIHVEGNGTFLVGDEVTVGCAADCQAIVGFAVGLDGMYSRRQCGDLLGIGITQLTHLLAGKRGNGDADVLDILFTLLRGDDDLFQYLGIDQPGNSETHQDNYDFLCHWTPPGMLLQ